jgi:hypothetical protein
VDRGPWTVDQFAFSAHHHNFAAYEKSECPFCVPWEYLPLSVGRGHIEE